MVMLMLMKVLVKALMIFLGACDGSLVAGARDGARFGHIGACEGASERLVKSSFL